MIRIFYHLLFYQATLCCMLVHGQIEFCPATNYSETRCVSREKAINTSMLFGACEESVSQPHLYHFLEDYSCLNNNLYILENTLAASTATTFCKTLLRAYVCNYAYPACDPDTNEPIGICTGNCLDFFFGTVCSSEVDVLVTFSGQTSGFKFLEQCNNTLVFVKDSGLRSVNTVNQSQEECVNISEYFLTENPVVTDIIVENSNVNTLAIILPGGVAAFIIVLGLLSVVWIVYKKRKGREKRGRGLRRPSSSNNSRAALTNFYISGSDHVYDEVPLFQLTMADVIDNPFLRDAMMPFDQLTILEEIGKGAFGCVFKALYEQQLDSGHEEVIEVAVKTIKDSTASYGHLKQFIEESVLMCSFDHPHVLGMVGICLDHNNSPYLLLPFMENGDLKNFLKKKRETLHPSRETYPEGLCQCMLMRMCNEIASGMEYIALQKLVHRDLAARNCMVDGNLSVKVADFGLTRDVYETNYYRQSKTGKIPIKWMSPENLHDGISSEKTDVWSYGIACWEVFSLGRTPYPTISNAEMLDYLDEGNRLRKPALCYKPMFLVMESCWNTDAKERPTFSELAATVSSLTLQSSQDDNHKLHSEVEAAVLSSKHLHSSQEEDSLFNSILNMLPSNYQTELMSSEDGPFSEGRMLADDYYTTMNQSASTTTTNTARKVINMEPGYAEVNGYDYMGSHDLSDPSHARSHDILHLAPDTIHVRQTSNTSEYLVMQSALVCSKSHDAMDSSAAPVHGRQVSNTSDYLVMHSASQARSHDMDHTTSGVDHVREASNISDYLVMHSAEV